MDPIRIAHRALSRYARRGGGRSVYVDTAVGRLHALDVPGQGTLPTVVLLHGITSAGSHYLRLIQDLRPHVRRIIAPDLPAHGLSDPLPAHQPINATTDGMLALLDHLHEEPALVFGLSMGGLAAVRYARHRPHHVRGLMLVSPAGAHQSRERLDVFLGGLKPVDHRSSLDFVDRVFVERLPIRRAVALGIQAVFANPSVLRMLDELEPEQLVSPTDLANLAMPLRMIWGKADRILPEEQMRFYLEHLPGHAHVEHPEDFGHAPFLDRHEALLAKILDFAHALDRGIAPAAGVMQGSVAG